MPALGRLAGRPGRRARPAAADRAARIGSRKPRDLADTLRLAWRHRGLDVRTIADVTRLMTMSHRRPARRLVRVAAGQGRARGQRRDRDLGRPVRAGHRLRDGAPLDRRRRRRPPGQLGLPGGRHGRGRRRDRRSAARETAPRSGPARGWPRSCVTGGRATGVVLESGEEIRATVGRLLAAPEDRVPGPRREGEPAGRLRRRTSSTGRPGAAWSRSTWRWPNCPTSPPIPAPTWQEHHTGSVEMAPSMEYIEQAFIEAREGRPATRPFSDGVIPTAFDKTLCPDGTHIMSLFTQWVPADWSEEPHQRGTGGVRRPDDRRATTRSRRTSSPRSSTATSSAPTRWSTTTG